MPKTFEIIIPITKAKGTRYVQVEADTAAEALKMAKVGNFDLELDEFEVIDIDMDNAKVLE